ncbi:MAG: homoserine dehydrogenase, partial [Lysobacterales bacterium]
MHETKLAFLGFGNVGRALARLLLSKRSELESRYGVSWRVVGLMTGSHGAAIDREGIDLEQALDLTARGVSLDTLSSNASPLDALTFITGCDADILFENTPVSYADGEPAVSHIRFALEAGMHVATANKGPVVHAYHELSQLAAERGRSFLFESTVMDGAPIFSLWRSALPGAKLDSLRGVLNSTTNLILTMMESGSSYEQALAHAQEIGIAETDPSGDIEGWDAAVKVAALVTVLMDHPLKPDQVVRQGIAGITPAMIEQALQNNQRWKLVCIARRNSNGVMAEVRPEVVERQDPLYALSGTSSAITFESDVLGPLTVLEENPGPQTTAYGLLADML